MDKTHNHNKHTQTSSETMSTFVDSSSASITQSDTVVQDTIEDATTLALAAAEDEVIESDDEDDEEHSRIQLGFLYDTEQNLLFAEPDWRNWDGGKVGGKPVSITFASLLTRLPIHNQTLIDRLSDTIYDCVTTRFGWILSIYPLLLNCNVAIAVSL
jgi:hypothetical protein